MLIFCINKIFIVIKRSDIIVVVISFINGFVRGLIFFFVIVSGFLYELGIDFLFVDV